MNIGIDIDDTISNTHDILFSYAQKYTSEDLKKELASPKDKVISGNGYCARFHNWNEQEEREFWKKYYTTIIQQVNPKKFAKEVISKLRKNGHKIYLITARFDIEENNIRQITREWLKENEIEYDGLIFNARDKVKAAKDNNIELLIDDAETNCRKVSEAGICTYIMDSMENQNCQIENVKRLYSWIHVEQEIESKEKIGGI